MQNIKDWIKIIKKKKSWKKNEFEINPNLYWRYLLIVVFLIISGSFVFGFIVYSNIKKEPIYITNKNIQTGRMDQKNRILEMLEYFDARKAKSDAIIKNPSPVVDPSL